MTQWMLVSRECLMIALFIIFRDLWVTSPAHHEYIIGICTSNSSFICALAGILDVRQHLANRCQSLTISVYHEYEGEYARACTDLVDYAAAYSRRNELPISTPVTAHSESGRPQILPGRHRYTQVFAIPSTRIATFIRDFVSRVTALEFVLIDCNATYGDWSTLMIDPKTTRKYPLSLIELRVAFAYTSPPPALLIDAPRSTFYPPRCQKDTPMDCWFDGVKKLVVRDANAYFVAFLTTACPLLERVESTADFCKEDVPVRMRGPLVFMRLPRTTAWPGVTGRDTIPRPDLEELWEAELQGLPSIPPSTVPVKTGKPFIPSETPSLRQVSTILKQLMSPYKRRKIISGASRSVSFGDAKDFDPRP
ncbi:hypothetical protein B0H16DRAFT_516093 [Mycena metata]|uniref:Uncharacterized protein n=1 Tax=Mycena metata TaxID=1033252 RepID=A0AAD7JFU8_9AGAR|nr:hypothetical protein B0H16DRAFT_516093 [Mycena metata]